MNTTIGRCSKSLIQDRPQVMAVKLMSRAAAIYAAARFRQDDGLSW